MVPQMRHMLWPAYPGSSLQTGCTAARPLATRVWTFEPVLPGLARTATTTQRAAARVPYPEVHTQGCAGADIHAGHRAQLTSCDGSQEVAEHAEKIDAITKWMATTAQSMKPPDS
jgi:hypothetical protein